jgi:G3E family GTPase
MDARPLADPLPVLLVAGALGAGKTTLVARWVAEPEFAASAVLLNELGEGAIDAHLVGGYAGATRTVCGCACCAARGALAAALEALADGRSGAPRFERAIVELAGIAHPLPVLEELAADAGLRERFPLQGLAVVVDATEGVRGLADPDARACAAAADVLVLAKTEHVDGAAVDRLAAHLARVNPHAEVVRVEPDGCHASDVWEAAAASPGRALRHLDSMMAGAAGHDVEVHTLHLPPVELSGFCMRLAAFLEAQSGAVLRAKGLIGVKGRKGPAVIQAVGRALHPVRTLKEWPPGAAPGTLRLVTRGLDAAAIRKAIA